MDADVRAAMDLWVPLAAAAWSRYLALGPGVLLVDREELMNAHGTRGAEDKASFEPGFVPLEMIPRGDDFRPLLARYDPTKQVMLLVRDADGEERMLTLEGDGVTRPAPEACYEAQGQRRG